MTWIQLFKFMFFCFGVFGSIKTLIRGTKFAVKPFNCSVCMGMWIGTISSVYFFPGLLWWEYILYGYVSAGTNWLLTRIVTGEF